jgi:vacuolar-type H+-ATPase subunit F/Vma7
MSKLIVIGSKRLTLPLSAIGFEPHTAADASELEATLEKLSVDRNVALVVCGESQAVDCPDALNHFRINAYGVLLVVPDTSEPIGLGRATLRKTIEQAAGVDLLGKSQSPQAQDERHV